MKISFNVILIISCLVFADVIVSANGSVQVTPRSATVQESEGQVQFTITRSDPKMATQIPVNHREFNAKYGEDFLFETDRVSFDAGQSTAKFNLIILQDREHESRERVIIEIAGIAIPIFIDNSDMSSNSIFFPQPIVHMGAPDSPIVNIIVGRSGDVSIAETFQLTSEGVTSQVNDVLNKGVYINNPGKWTPFIMGPGQNLISVQVNISDIQLWTHIQTIVFGVYSSGNLASNNHEGVGVGIRGPVMGVMSNAVFNSLNSITFLRQYISVTPDQSTVTFTIIRRISAARNYLLSADASRAQRIDSIVVNNTIILTKQKFKENEMVKEFSIQLKTDRERNNHFMLFLRGDSESDYSDCLVFLQ